jgi:putative spermidine/putrescine transport system ATP-binding protein
LFVTHDQEEALAVADRVGVMRAGRLEQIATPVELYGHPATPFVAEFVGLSNRLEATVTEGKATVLGVQIPTLPGSVQDGRGRALVRPEAVSVTSSGDGAATVVSVHFLGPISRVHCQLSDGQEVEAQISSAQAATLSPQDKVALTVAPDPVLVVGD